MVEPVVVEAPQFRIGAVISRGLSIYIRNFLALLPVSIIAMIPTALVTFWSYGGGFSGSTAIFWLLDYVGFCWLSAGVTYAVVSDLRGQRASGAEVFGRSLASIPRLLLLFLIIAIVFMLAMLLMLVPLIGFFFAVPLIVWLYVVYWVALPVVVVERSGPIISMGRSKDLTQGRRWQVLGILLIWFVILFVTGILIELVLVSAFSAVGSVTFAGATALIDTVVLALGASLAAVGYHDLRVEKEGVGTEEIARVFD